MALPRSKYSEPFHTPGNEFTLDGKNYVGWYVITYKDQYIAGTTVDRKSKQIFPIESENDNIDTVKVFVEQKVEPTIDDRVQGSWRRYFIQNKNNLHIIEVTKERHNAYKNTSGFTVASLDWNLTLPAENITRGPYIYYGSAHKNELATKALESTIPGISSFIKDYSQFVE